MDSNHPWSTLASQPPMVLRGRLTDPATSGREVSNLQSGIIRVSPLSLVVHEEVLDFRLLSVTQRQILTGAQ